VKGGRAAVAIFKQRMNGSTGYGRTKDRVMNILKAKVENRAILVKLINNF